MRRIGVFVAALAMTLVVAAAGTAARPAVTISLSRPSVVYGGSVSLSGKVSDNKAGETVNVLAEPSGATGFSMLGSATTSAGGRWTDAVKPTIETSYEAKWKSEISSTVTVKVRPLITLTLVHLSTGTFSTKVTAARSFAGKFVLVQRLSSSGVATQKKVILDTNSSATFSVKSREFFSRLTIVDFIKSCCANSGAARDVVKTAIARSAFLISNPRKNSLLQVYLRGYEISPIAGGVNSLRS